MAIQIPVEMLMVVYVTLILPSKYQIQKMSEILMFPDFGYPVFGSPPYVLVQIDYSHWTEQGSLY